MAESACLVCNGVGWTLQLPLDAVRCVKCNPRPEASIATVREAEADRVLNSDTPPPRRQRYAEAPRG